MSTAQQLRREIKELLSSGVSSDGGTIGGATASKQDQIIALLTQLSDRLAGHPALTPSLQVVTTDGTLSGVKLASIGIRSGAGTILGAPVDTSIAVVEFPYVPVGYESIPYTINPGGEFIIVSGS